MPLIYQSKYIQSMHFIYLEFVKGYDSSKFIVFLLKLLRVIKNQLF